MSKLLMVRCLEGRSSRFGVGSFVCTKPFDRLPAATEYRATFFPGAIPFTQTMHMENNPSAQLKNILEQFIDSIAEDGILHASISITGPVSFFQPALPRQVISAGDNMYVVQQYQPATKIPADIMLRHDDSSS